MQRVEKGVLIDVSRSEVWDALTDPAAMRQWMGEPEMRINVATNWRVGDSIRISGHHHISFENDGIVLAFEPAELLRYTHRSSISRLPQEASSYTTLEFRLDEAQSRTALRLVIEGFPTESIRKHLDFYWNSTVEVLKAFVERAAKGRVVGDA